MKKIAMTLLLLSSIFMLTGCNKNKQPTEETKTETQVEITVEDDQKIPNKEEDKLAQLYASVSCMVMDPKFREGFRDGENGREDEEQADDTIENLYKKYGYDSEEEVEEALKKVANKKSFAEKLVKSIEDTCEEFANQEILDQITNNLKEEYGE